MKPGTWIDVNGERRLVVSVSEAYWRYVDFKDAVYQIAMNANDPHIVLHGCDGWDWSVGEGYRLLDPKVDKPQGGDDYFANGSWFPRRIIDKFGSSTTYRRKLEPPKPDPGETYRPYANQAEAIEHLQGKLIVSKHAPDIVRVVVAYYVCTVEIAEDGRVGYDELVRDWVDYRTNEPCGVKQ